MVSSTENTGAGMRCICAYSLFAWWVRNCYSAHTGGLDAVSLVIVYDLITLNRLAQVECKGGEGGICSFSPDGMSMVMGRQVFSLEDLYELTSLRVVKGIGSTQFSPCGHVIAAVTGTWCHGMHKGTLILCDATTSDILWEKNVDCFALPAIAFSGDGSIVAVWPVTGSMVTVFKWCVLLVATETGISLRTIATEVNGPYVQGCDTAMLAFSPDGNSIVLGNNNSREGPMVASYSTKPITELRKWKMGKGVAWDKRHYDREWFISENGKCVASHENDDEVLIWDIETGREMKIDLGGRQVAVICISPDSKAILAGTTYLKGDKLFCCRFLYDMGTEKVKWRTRNYNLDRLQFSPDGNKIIAYASEGYRGIQVCCAGTGAFLWKTVGKVSMIACSLSNVLALYDRHEGIVQIDCADNRKDFSGNRIDVGRDLHTLCFSPGGDNILYATSKTLSSLYWEQSGKNYLTEVRSGQSGVHEVFRTAWWSDDLTIVLCVETEAGTLIIRLYSLTKRKGNHNHNIIGETLLGNGVLWVKSIPVPEYIGGACTPFPIKLKHTNEVVMCMYGVDQNSLSVDMTLEMFSAKDYAELRKRSGCGSSVFARRSKTGRTLFHRLVALHSWEHCSVLAADPVAILASSKQTQKESKTATHRNVPLTKVFGVLMQIFDVGCWEPKTILLLKMLDTVSGLLGKKQFHPVHFGVLTEIIPQMASRGKIKVVRKCLELGFIPVVSDVSPALLSKKYNIPLERPMDQALVALSSWKLMGKIRRQLYEGWGFKRGYCSDCVTFQPSKSRFTAHPPVFSKNQTLVAVYRFCHKCNDSRSLVGLGAQTFHAVLIDIYVFRCGIHNPRGNARCYAIPTENECAPACRNFSQYFNF